MAAHVSLSLPWHHVHFTGAGGVGMAGLAHILGDTGVHVSGTDDVASSMLESLQIRGFDVVTGHDPKRLCGADLLVYSTAVPENNPERQAAQAQGIPTMVRGRFLAELAGHFGCVVSIGGSHGKTTTTAMLTHILHQAGIAAGCLVGGQVKGQYRSARAGDGSILVTEVDESDGTQAYMNSSIAVVTNVEDDHSWSVGGLEALHACFATFAQRARTLITWSTPTTETLFAEHPHAIRLGESDIPPDLVLPLAGRHNRINATLALHAALLLGVSRSDALQALATFPGVQRRLTEHFCTPDDRIRLVEDYAHHPTELRATLDSLREELGSGCLWVIFQPHRFERVRRYAAEFGRILAGADRAWVVGPFAAWQADETGADAGEIVSAMAASGADGIYHRGSLDELATQVAEQAATQREPVLLAVIGAGDVTRIVPPLCRALAAHCLGQLQAAIAAELPQLRLSRGQCWGELTTLGVGRAHPLLATPENRAELLALQRWAHARGLHTRALGAGSNLVGTDDEPPRLWIQLLRSDFLALSRSGTTIRAGAGICLYPLFAGLAAQGLGLPHAAWLPWIPGTLGGALRLNAGAGGCCIGEFVLDLEGVTPDGTPWRAAADDIDWEYRHSSIPEDVIITAARLRLEQVDPATMMQAIAKAGNERHAQQPQGRSAGCMFRNPPGDSAGRLLDQAGCKGLAAGAARISDIHANFLVIPPEKSASEADVLALLRRVQLQVFRCHGVVLTPEVRFAGPRALADIEAQMGALREQAQDNSR